MAGQSLVGLLETTFRDDTKSNIRAGESMDDYRSVPGHWSKISPAECKWCERKLALLSISSKTRYSCIVARRAAGAISAYRSRITATLLKPELVRTTIPGCASWAPLLSGFSSGTRGTDVRLILPFRVLTGWWLCCRSEAGREEPLVVRVRAETMQPDHRYSSYPTRLGPHIISIGGVIISIS